MKKALSIILAISIAVCSLLCLSLGVSAAEPNMLYDFSVSANLSKLQINTGGNSATVYDANEKAVKVYPAATDAASLAKPLSIRISDSGHSVNYRFIAMRIKLSANTVRNNSFWVADSSWTGSWNFPGTRYYKNYVATTDWQTVIIDTSGLTANSTYKYIFANLAVNGSYGADDYVLVQWVGSFASLSDANSYNLIIASANTEDTNPDLYYDFTVPASKNYVSDAFNGTVSFDTNESALKVSVADSSSTNPLSFRINEEGWNSNQHIASSYPILAMRIKTATNAMTFNGMYASDSTWTGSWNTAGTNFRQSTMTATNEWQTVIVDTTGVLAVNMPYKYILPLINKTQNTDYFHIKWFASFSTVEAATAYAATFDAAHTNIDPLTPGKVYDFTNSETSSRLATLLGNTVLEQDAVTGAAKITPLDLTYDATNVTEAAQNPMVVSLSVKNDKIDIATYPVLAIRVRVNDAMLEYNGTYFNGTFLGKGEPNNGTFNCSASYTYTGDAEWQTIILDTTDYYSLAWPNRCFMGDWDSFSLKFAKREGEEWVVNGDTAWIKWAGFFRNTAAAEAYVDTFGDMTASVEQAGDINIDGDVNVLDLIRYKKYLADPENYPFAFTLLSADYDDDKEFTSLDLVFLRSVLLGTRSFQ